MPEIQVDGLRELTKALRKMSGETPKEVSKFHKDVARFLVPEVKRRADARPRKTRTGRIAATTRASGTQRKAAIKVGGIRGVEDAAVQEWGGRAPLFGDRTNWFQVRKTKRSGYFLNPAIRDNRQRIERFYLKGLDVAIKRYWQRVS